MNAMRSLRAMVVLLLAAAAGLAAAAAQDWPTRAVKIVCPFPAGGGADVLSRKLAVRLSVLWKQPVIVENKPGGAQIIAATTVMRASPDGYTLLLGTEASMQSNQFLFSKLPYLPARDFTPISRMVGIPEVFVVREDSPYRTIDQLVAGMKANPGKVSYGSAGVGSTVHLVTEWFAKTAGDIRLLHVPYQGSAPRLQALLAGQIDFTVTPLADVTEHVRAHRLRALATTSELRMKQLPGVPTLGELGYKGNVFYAMFALLGPAGMGADLANRIASDTGQVLRDPELRADFIDPNAYEVFAQGPAEFVKFLAADLENQRARVKAANVVLD